MLSIYVNPGRKLWGRLRSLLLLGAHTSCVLAAGELRLGSDAWPPFTDAIGEPRVALEIVHTALTRIGVKAETTIVDAGSLIPAIREGSSQGSAALWRTPEREEFLVYSEPYLENRLILVGRRGADVSASSWQDLRGRKVAVVRAYGYGLDDVRDGPDFVPEENGKANLQALRDGKVDYVLMDELVAQHMIENSPPETRSNYVIGLQSMVRRTLHLALRRDVPDVEGIIARFNQQVQAMQADGTYHEILRLNWIRVDVDGDGKLEMVLSGTAAGTERPREGYRILTYSFKEVKAAQENEAYVVEGKRYSRWEEVPDVYKVPRSGFESSGSGAELLNLRF